MALRRKPVRYERVLAVSLGVRGSSIPTTTWGALVRTCRHRYGTGQKAYRDLLGGGSPLTHTTALAFLVWRWGERVPSLKRTVFLNRLFPRLVRLEPDDDCVRDETCGLRRSIRLACFQVKIAQNRRSDILIPTVWSLSLMKSPPQLLPQSMSCDERSWTCSMRYFLP